MELPDDYDVKISAYVPYFFCICVEIANCIIEELEVDIISLIYFCTYTPVNKNYDYKKFQTTRKTGVVPMNDELT